MLKTISVKTSAQTEMVDVTGQVQKELSKSGVEEGRLTLYVPHTTAAITINEGADPAVTRWCPGRQITSIWRATPLHT